MMERDVKSERLGLMVLRFILYSVIAYFVIRFIKSFFSGAKNAKLATGSRKRVAATMIRCDACGTFITESSAVPSGNHLFCSKSCVKVGIQRT
jgi:hypothetical protein